MTRLFLSIFTAFLLVGALPSAARDTEAADSTLGIVTVIMDSNPMIVIDQPDALSERLMPGYDLKVAGVNRSGVAAPEIQEGIRYRVQVFSDNNRQNAKTKAEYRKRLIEQRMPGVHGYVTYDSPYWRVRMGNYKTEAEAQTAMKQIKSKFPQFSADVRVVKVRAK